MNLDKTPLFISLLKSHRPKEPLSSNELACLRAVKTNYSQIKPLTATDRCALCMLIGIELQHQILERELCLQGKKSIWDRASYAQLLKEFSRQIKYLHNKDQSHMNQFAELWREIKAEFQSDEELLSLLTIEKTSFSVVQKKPLNINSRTNTMPIASIEAGSLILFNAHSDLKSLIDAEQNALEKRLHNLMTTESIQAQEDGYYYENYGFFNANTLNTLFKLTPDKSGIASLSQNNCASLLVWLNDQGWIKHVKNTDKFQLPSHPSAFFSAPKLASYLSKMGLSSSDVKKAVDKIDTFLYETAVHGGIYSLRSGAEQKLTKKLSEAQNRYNLEYLQAQDKIALILSQAAQQITFSELNSAYLLDDYSRITEFFSPEKRSEVATILNNALTRMLFYKTELDHLNDVQEALKREHKEQAISMLHVRRNYKLDQLLSFEETTSAKNQEQLEQEQKMQRAFLLFESEFGHRCTARQVDVFHGLLIDDETNPNKIDAAQARMGFGKTSLLPLVALFKTGEQLVRFIVPKSALETNTADMSSVLTKLLGTRAIKDDFHRYRIEKDDEMNPEEQSPRLISLRDAKADLARRLAHYKDVKERREVLVQGPHVRNSIECQAKVFLDLLLKIKNKPEQEHELIQCITLINEIRSLTTLSIFDELDATQDVSTTDVNYTAGEKISLDAEEINPLELITLSIRSAENKSIDNLATMLLKKANIPDLDGAIKNYVTSLETLQPSSVDEEHNKTIYLIRALLTDPSLLSLCTEKEPCTDFGVWFQNANNGNKIYDYNSLASSTTQGQTSPLLIAVPYSAANTPKPQGSRFDNPEVTAIASFLYYLDNRTEIQEVPHLEFLINSIRNGSAESSLLDAKGSVAREFHELFNHIKELASIEDSLIGNAAREQFFNLQLSNPKIQATFRKMLARTVIKEQIQFDAGKANSNRYEQGTPHDLVIGFSGTAADTSFHFKQVRTDPAADGTLTLGIMGRNNCQLTIPLDTKKTTTDTVGYTTHLIQQLSQSFSGSTRALIDVGGLCKASNRSVAKAIALQLQETASISKINGVIFYDDVTNTKKVLVLHTDGEEKVIDLTQELVNNAELQGNYFTYYDQAHSRGADIKQMDEAQAILTLNFTVTNNDYKQAIMRMRKIIDKSSGQSFSVAVPSQVRERIIEDLQLAVDHQVTGNDIAYWLRQKELLHNKTDVSLIVKELDSVIMNAILQQQATITHLIGVDNMTPEHRSIFRECIEKLNKITPFISLNTSDLKAKYGNAYGIINKADFVLKLRETFANKLLEVFNTIDRTREQTGLNHLTEEEKQLYYDMEARIIQKREAALNDKFMIPSSKNALADVQSEVEMETETEIETQTETHSFSQVTNEEVVIVATLQKQNIPYAARSIDFLNTKEQLEALPFASQVSQLQHLFTQEDSIRCSPGYEIESDTQRPSPPVRYFLAREKGNPQIILIHQDEADLFKHSANKKWSLYTLSLENESILSPITNEPVSSLKGPLLKKLAFAAFKHRIKGDSLNQIADSLAGLYSRTQLEPSLTIDYGSAKKQTGFQFDEWGFSGNNTEQIDLQVRQLHETFNGPFEKTGVTITLGQKDARADLFISSKLNRRILTELDKTSAEKPVIQSVEDDIKRDCTTTVSHQQQIKQESTALKERKKILIETFNDKIANLKEKKEIAFKKTKDKIQDLFAEHIKKYLHVRMSLTQTLSEDILYYCSAGLTVADVEYDSMSHALTQLRDQYLADILTNEDHFTKEQLEVQLAKIVKAILPGAHEKYSTFSRYNEKQGTFIEALQKVLDAPVSAGKTLLINLNEMRIWGTTCGEAYKEHFAPFFDDEESEERLFKCFEKALLDCVDTKNKKNVTHLLLLEANILKRVRAEYNSDSDFMDEFTAKLSYTLNTGTRAGYKASIEKEIEYTIRAQLIKSISELDSSHEALAIKAVEILKAKIHSEQAYALPSLLMNFTDSHSTDAIQDAIKHILANQNVSVTAWQFDQLTQETVWMMKQYETTNQQVLEHYIPIDHRAASLINKEGSEYLIPPDVHEAIMALDAEVLGLQKELNEAQAQRKAERAKIDDALKILGSRLKDTKEQLKIFKTERSAINKLLTGLNQLLPVFKTHKVELKAQTPETFIAQHFNLKKIINEKISISATLTFQAPEIYKVEDDLQEQVINLHGLTETEALTKKSINNALTIVRNEAELIRKRKGLTRDKQPQLESILSSRTNEHSESASAVTTESEMPNKPISQFGLFKSPKLPDAPLLDQNKPQNGRKK